VRRASASLRAQDNTRRSAGLLPVQAVRRSVRRSTLAHSTRARKPTSGANPQQPLGAGKQNAPRWCGALGVSGS